MIIYNSYNAKPAYMYKVVNDAEYRKKFRDTFAW
jgi:hypothetical protein